ncbi:MAG TPA: prepilin-type N-terminal cleavage/methylation domain-containing protein [Nitriliruptorales bacterium]|nr:prepilin-type N-terminal cleavage/methylation domain-containing protein [Nitriliruptorales bacterium]
MLTARGGTHQFSPDESGLTLVELLVVLVIVGVATAIATATMIDSLGATRRADERIQALTEVQTASRRLTREIRVADGAAYPATADGEILVGDSDEIQVDVYRAGTRIRFRYYTATVGGVEVLREQQTVFSPPTSSSGAVGTARTVVERLANGSNGTPVFVYLTEDGVTAPDGDGDGSPEEVARVQITLVRALPEQSDITIDTAVGLRNARG